MLQKETLISLQSKQRNCKKRSGNIVRSCSLYSVAIDCKSFYTIFKIASFCCNFFHNINIIIIVFFILQQIDETLLLLLSVVIGLLHSVLYSVSFFSTGVSLFIVICMYVHIKVQKSLLQTKHWFWMISCNCKSY